MQESAFRFSQRTWRKPKSLLKKAEKAQADFVEVRMDCLEETRNLSDLAKSTKIPLIAANKLASEKGFFSGTEAERQQTLLAAAKKRLPIRRRGFL